MPKDVSRSELNLHMKCREVDTRTSTVLMARTCERVARVVRLRLREREQPEKPEGQREEREEQDDQRVRTRRSGERRPRAPRVQSARQRRQQHELHDEREHLGATLSDGERWRRCRARAGRRRLIVSVCRQCVRRVRQERRVEAREHQHRERRQEVHECDGGEEASAQEEAARGGRAAAAEAAARAAVGGLVPAAFAGRRAVDAVAARARTRLVRRDWSRSHAVHVQYDREHLMRSLWALNLPFRESFSRQIRI